MSKLNHLEGGRESTEKLLNEYIDYLMENSDSAHPAWNLEIIRSGKENKWNYIDGCMIRGILSLYDITGDEKYLNFASDFVSGFISDDGTIRTYDVEEKNLDNINPAKNLFTLYDKTGKEKYLKAIKTVRSQVDKMPRTNAGNFWHKNIYPYQVWLDGLYMAQPFYIEYEKRFNDCRNAEDIYNQFCNVEKYMRDSKTGLYYHGYDETKSMYWADPDTGCSRNFWLRAEGWFIMSLVDVLEIMQGMDMKTEFEHLKNMLIDLSEALLKYQDESGLWYQLIALPDLEGNYLETSGTALISAAMLKGVRLGFLPGKFRSIGQKAFYGIIDHRLSKNEDGSPCVTGICLVAGLGGQNHRDGSVSYYLSEPIVKNDAKGVGPLFLAYTEMIR
ncbi:glycoside hydrolase family 88/105 protein [Oribacterium sp. WCC10]|uniref:glycoside hydrolase family 88/105 protein n=1 Tax=Oribacterium sp. WCC10 TaxID=1855343 RepID=UPI0008ED2824|nr:glycoside hydrolase family 88 protein [Oribacterium sp. WCC10]SFG53910.1 unsaturated rhamnogalacturonyl hydrolase [Oribacterium sp. WCC10]